VRAEANLDPHRGVDRVRGGIRLPACGTHTQHGCSCAKRSSPCVPTTTRLVCTLSGNGRHGIDSSRLRPATRRRMRRRYRTMAARTVRPAAACAASHGPRRRFRRHRDVRG
jgi:hypothetical protein